MHDLSAFDITEKWPAQYPERIQLYSLATPNGVKVSIMLEEIGLPYEVHKVDFESAEQLSPEFISLNPNNKIPAIIDPNGPDDEPMPLWESGAILIYLAEKSGKLLPEEPQAYYQTLQWLMFQVGGVGPMFGQLGYFYRYAGSDIDDKRPQQRYVKETQRLLAVIEQQLTQHDWIVGDDYSIADIAIFPWIHCLMEFYGAGELIGIDNYPQVQQRLRLFLNRPAVQRGMLVPE